MRGDGASVSRIFLRKGVTRDLDFIKESVDASLSIAIFAASYVLHTGKWRARAQQEFTGSACNTVFHPPDGENALAEVVKFNDAAELP